jgi:mannose-6-phosphate isomerase-like protein (cupin superfamily)
VSSIRGGDPFPTTRLPRDATVVAPDGSDVRVLLATERASMAHFELAAGKTSTAVRHRTVDEIWYLIGGRGEMWRRRDGEEAVTVLEAGTCLVIPVGTSFQFRSLGPEPLAAVAVTIPPWPGDDEAEFVDGHPAWTEDSVKRIPGGR